MKNFNELKKHCNAFYDKKQREAKKAPNRYDSRGALVPMTPAGLKAEARKIEKQRARDLARIEAAEAFGGVSYMKIKIEWHRSSVWGYNPRAEAWTGSVLDLPSIYGTGSASGCGYDKESAAAAGAIRGAGWDWLVFSNWKKLKKACGGHPFYYDKRWALPFYELSGCGMTVLRHLAELAGMRWEEYHSKTSDFYFMEKKHSRKK